MVALKELSIRGDFRTTVEYLIKLFETEEYQNNKITTGWLDKLISENVQAEKPDVMLGVISGALHIGDYQIQDCFQTFQASLERGQILPANSLKNHVDVEFISEGIKYNVKVSILGNKMLIFREIICQGHAKPKTMLRSVSRECNKVSMSEFSSVSRYPAMYKNVMQCQG